MADRLDKVLAERGLVTTRSRARDLILRGLVTVNGVVATKPGAVIAADAAIVVAAGGAYVSRGALKLEAGLEAFSFSPQDLVCLDVGASTGGFTEVLLVRGATKVYAVDVGHLQLHPRISCDSRVVSIEGFDARRLRRAQVPDPVQAIVADVSFISLEKVLPASLKLSAPGAWLVALVKPQFEAGRAAIGKGGIVRDASVREQQAEKIAQFIDAQPGWSVVGVVASPITGGSGNQEFLLGARRDG